MMTPTHFCQAPKAVLLIMGICGSAPEALGNPRAPARCVKHLALCSRVKEATPNCTEHRIQGPGTNQTLYAILKLMGWWGRQIGGILRGEGRQPI